MPKRLRKNGCIGGLPPTQGLSREIGRPEAVVASNSGLPGQKFTEEEIAAEKLSAAAAYHPQKCVGLSGHMRSDSVPPSSYLKSAVHYDGDGWRDLNLDRRLGLSQCPTVARMEQGSNFFQGGRYFASTRGGG
jgi:hypothetical protein